MMPRHPASVASTAELLPVAESIAVEWARVGATGHLLARNIDTAGVTVFMGLVDAYTPGLMRMAQTVVGDPAAADEIVQEAWLAALRGIDGFDGRSSLKAWVFPLSKLWLPASLLSFPIPRQYQKFAVLPLFMQILQTQKKSETGSMSYYQTDHCMKPKPAKDWNGQRNLPGKKPRKV